MNVAYIKDLQIAETLMKTVYPFSSILGENLNVFIAESDCYFLKVENHCELSSKPCH